eukprot:4377592-Karenia_brevis.AAC.1
MASCGEQVRIRPIQMSIQHMQIDDLQLLEESGLLVEPVGAAVGPAIFTVGAVGAVVQEFRIPTPSDRSLRSL